MPLTLNYKFLPEKTFNYPLRCFVSGSSESGKTYFSHQLLKHSHLFSKQIKQVIYYHPDYLTHVPVAWHNTLNIPVSYQSGLPSLQELCDLKPYTCVVLDDMFEECINSSTIDYLFRVLSGKNKLSVLILSQRYFATGKYGLNIRNNCNYTVLMRNVDSKLNFRVASLLSLKIPIQKAIIDTYENNFWPYIFIDSTPRGQVSTHRCYTDIFSPVQKAFNQLGMKAYIINEQDFLRHFEILSKGIAIENGNNKKLNLENTKQRINEEKNTSPEIESSFNERIRKRARGLRKERSHGKNI